jgi:hypothetical protein
MKKVQFVAETCPDDPTRHLMTMFIEGRNTFMKGKSKPGMTPEQAVEDFRAKYPQFKIEFVDMRI